MGKPKLLFGCQRCPEFALCFICCCRHPPQVGQEVLYNQQDDDMKTH